MIKAFLVNTVVASLVFAFVWAALEYDWIGLRIPVPPAPTH
jgi:hypothetical protein